MDDPRSLTITNFINGLSPSERRQVRLQLGDDADGLTGFETLPADIICLVIRYLQIEDALACAAVSRRARATWTEPSVSGHLTLRFFPAQQAPFSSAGFRRACRRYFRRRAGHFSSRFEMDLPDPFGSAVRFDMHKWQRECGFRPCPTVHPDGKYPQPWLAVLFFSDFACFGGGNVVWYALPDSVVIDNMYSKLRKIVSLSHEGGGISSAKGQHAASRSLVALQPYSADRLTVYNIETNTTSHCQLPGPLLSMVIRDSRIFIVLPGLQIVVLDHDGSRLTTLQFKADKGLESECPEFATEGRPISGIYPHRGPIFGIYPHPHLPERFFVSMIGYMDVEQLPEEVASPEDPDNEGPVHVRSLIVREFHGDTPVAIYHHDMYKSPPGALALPDPSLEAEEFRTKNADISVTFNHARVTEALDSQGTFGTGFWVVGRGFSRPGDSESIRQVEAAGLPPVPNKFAHYLFQGSFNVLTKKFGIQRYLDPRVDPGSCRTGAPYEKQDHIPWASRGSLRLRRFDADADFVLGRRPTAKTKGERKLPDGWTVKAKGLKEGMPEAYEMYHDEDFTLLYMYDYKRVVVWSFLEDEEGDVQGQAVPESRDGPVIAVE